MKQLKYVWFIAMKDLKLFTKDRFALLFALLFPFLFAAMFYFLLGGVGSADVRLELHLATQEKAGGMSYQILQGLETKDESQLKPGEPRIVWDKDYAEARQAVADKKMAGFIAFPEDFTEGIMTGGGTKLEVVINTESTNTQAALNGLAQGIAAQVSTQQVAASAVVDIMVAQEIASGRVADMAQIQQTVQQLYLNQQNTGDASLKFSIQKVGEVEAENPSNYVIPGYLVMFVFFAAALAAESIVRERQNQTLERLLASAVRREAILGGIFTGTALKGLIQIAVFWVVGILAFKMELGLAPGAVILLSILMVIMSSAFAVMLATLSKTQRGAGAIAVLASLVLAPLGGCWWPLFITPKWMQFLAQLTPHGWATTGFNKLMVFGADFSAAVPNMLALVGFAAVFAIIATWRFRTSAT
jgi:ABC-2 type transport system permease protein